MKEINTDLHPELVASDACQECGHSVYDLRCAHWTCEAKRGMQARAAAPPGAAGRGSPVPVRVVGQEEWAALEELSRRGVTTPVSTSVDTVRCMQFEIERAARRRRW